MFEEAAREVVRPLDQTLAVVGPQAASGVLDRVALFELSVEERRLQFGEQIARAKVDPRVLVDLAAEECLAVRPFLSQDACALH